jgi:hypothetical protein
MQRQRFDEIAIQLDNVAAVALANKLARIAYAI